MNGTIVDISFKDMKFGGETLGVQYREGNLSDNSAAGISALADQLIADLKAPGQTNGSHVAEVTKTVNGQVAAQGIGVLTRSECVDEQGKALIALVERHQAQRAKLGLPPLEV